MARYKITLAYDGTQFFGMQRQASERTVQAEVETALRKLGWQDQSILAAGRTDRGVHASGQVIAFDLDWAHPDGKLRDALNANLPSDLAVRQVEEANEDFHPRFDARWRQYEYRLLCQSWPNPLLERYVWRLWPEVDITEMNTACLFLRGEHDFAAFGTPPKEGGSTSRNVLKAAWARENEQELRFTIRANGFLYHMVRRMVGMLVKVGQGLLESSDVEQVLSKKELIQDLAPAQGLTLVGVGYAEKTE